MNGRNLRWTFCVQRKKVYRFVYCRNERIDCLVFTAGIGENTWQVRRAVCEGMSFFGITIDALKNEQKNDGSIHDISGADSKVKVLVIPTNEELVIARETKELVEGKAN